MNKTGSSQPAPNKPNSELADSVKWLRLAVAKIQELAIPATPEVYSIWYEYYSGRKPNLKKVIDRRIENGRPFTADACEQIFQQYFVEIPEQKLAEIRQAIQSLINLLQIELGEAESDMESFETTLESCEESLNKEPELESLHEIIQTLLEETKKGRRRNRHALQKVCHLTKEINDLQTSLAKMSEEVYLDGLTGIGNRKGFDKELRAAISQSRSSKLPMSLIMLDIDLFKRVNDEHGHIVGDRVLRFVSETLKRSVKGGDYVARYGGEEFALILPNTDIEGGQSVAKHLQANVAGTKLTIKKGGDPIQSVTLSGGLSALRPEDTADSLLRRIDRYLYDAKDAGRNRIKSDQDD